MWVIVVNGYHNPRGRGEGVTVAIQRVWVGCRVYGCVDGGEHATLDRSLWTDGPMPVLIIHTGTMPAERQYHQRGLVCGLCIGVLGQYCAPVEDVQTVDGHEACKCFDATISGCIRTAPTCKNVDDAAMDLAAQQTRPRRRRGPTAKRRVRVCSIRR